MTQLISLGKLRFNFEGTYNGSTTYEFNDVVTYGGNLYVYKFATADSGNVPTDTTHWSLLLASNKFNGEWSAVTTYRPNDVVQYAGSTWVSLVDNNLNSAPTTSNSNWDLFLQGDADTIMTAAGDMIYRDGSGAAVLPIGVQHGVLQVDSYGYPSWNRTITGADDVKLTGQLYGGNGAPAVETDLGLTNIQAVFKGNADGFSQFAIHNANSGESASTDFIAYADDGDNNSGWIDMGITSSTFSDATYSVTGPGDGYIFMSAPSTTTGHGNLYLSTSSNGSENDIVFSTDGFASANEKMRLVGTAHGMYNAGLNLMDDVSTTNGKFYIGPDAKTLTIDDVGSGYVGLTNATAVFTGNADDFVQFAIKNNDNGTSASTDLIAYSSNGDNDSGWIDMGITSENYADPAFTVTGPDTGYIFMSAKSGTTGSGNLLIGTDATGTNNDIVFFTNGFDAGNERVRIIGEGVNAGVAVYANTESTSTTTGALRVEGGIGLQGNLYVGGDVNIVGNITLGGSGNTVETETLSVTNPIIFMGTGNSADLKDLGVVGVYTSTGAKYTGLVRDASDSGTWSLFSGLTTEPTDTVNFSGVTYDTVKLGGLSLQGSTSGYTKLQAAATTTSVTYTLPSADGTSGQALVTNGSGTLSWTTNSVTITDDTSTNGSFYPALLSATSGTTTEVNSSSTKLTFNPSTGLLTTSAVSAASITATGTTTLQQVTEVLNTKTAATGVVTHDYSTGDIFYHSSISANFTVNLTNVPTTNSRTIVVTIVLAQGATPYLSNAFQIDGVAQTIKWAGNTTPTVTANKVDVAVFTLMRVSSTWTVLGQLSSYG